MIQVDKIEIGKSVEALHEWNKLSLTVSILPGEDPQLIHNEAKELLDKLLPGIDSPVKMEEGSPIVDELIQKQFEETKGKIMAASSKAAAGEILINSGFKLNLELKTLVNLKPE